MGEELKDLKKRFTSIVESQVNGDLSKVDAKELGEVVDMIKDLAEAIYYCDITEAMEKSTTEEKEHYMGKYAPETQKYYTRPMYNDMGTDIPIRQRMYFTEPKTMMGNRPIMGDHNYKDGRAYMSRRTYMEMKEHGNDASSEMEKYLADLATDLTEMIEDMTPNEKAILKQKLTGVVSRIA